MWHLPYVRHDSRLENVFKTQTNSIATTGMILAGVGSMLVSYFLLHEAGVILFFVMCGVSIITGWYYLKQLGGATGDCFGATIKVTEIVCYISAAALFHL
jgi:adenosylcobinamide-GDP ribazoletransferase